MKKLAILQAVACIVAYAVGSSFGFEISTIVVFAWLPSVAAGYIGLWWFRNAFFFRDPERVIPQGDDLILSPADGRVMYLYPVKGEEVTADKKGKKIRITELAKTEIKGAEGWLLGIYMTPFDVHYSRAPIEGEITT